MKWLRVNGVVGGLEVVEIHNKLDGVGGVVDGNIAVS
jgi:hypothetical protein